MEVNSRLSATIDLYSSKFLLFAIENQERFFYLFTCLFIYLFVYLFIYLCIYLFIYTAFFGSCFFVFEEENYRILNSYFIN